MKDKDLDRIARDPKFARPKAMSTKTSRTVKQLFEGVEDEATFKDKRGRPWLKNPRAYVKAKLARKQIKEDEASDSDNDAISAYSSSSENVRSTSSESDDDVDPSESIADLYEADWYELTKDAVPTTTTGKRLALLHFDWDNAKAENVYMVLESFLPARGHIERVTIYPSEFGMKRLAEETVKGPPELTHVESDEPSNEQNGDAAQSTSEQHLDDAVVDTDDKLAWRKASVNLKRRLRQYQLARLKYFYAIIEFDSAETAEAVYHACDGYEYESSGARFDLRFVNDNETFSVPPEYAHLVSECREINKTKYTPRLFEIAALRSTRVEVTWDKTPDERTSWFRDQFKPEADPKRTLTQHRDELEKYFALSSSGASTAASSDVDEPPPAPTVPRVRRHRPRKMPPDELRTTLLGGATGTTDDNDTAVVTANADEDGEDGGVIEEEIMDINTDLENDEYDLGPVEKLAKTKQSRNRRVPRKVLPEALDTSSDEADLGDVREERCQQQIKRKKLKQNQRNKMLMKKRKIQERLDKEAVLWPRMDCEDVTSACAVSHDDRFDAFLTDPTYGISQTHPNYKEAAEFLRYMRRRKALLASLKRDQAVKPL